MKLNDITTVVENQQAMAVLEQRLAADLNIDSLNASKASYLNHKVNRLLESYRTSAQRYDSHQDPNYLKLLMMSKALRSRLDEVATTGATAAGAMAPAAAPAAGTAPAADPTKAAALQTAQVAEKKKAIQQQIKQKQQEIQELQKTINNPALMATQENRQFRRRAIAESEVQEAQVVLAAQDLVDRVQEMIEDASEMQFKDLPALVDSIRNQVGMDQANAFNTTVSQSMQGLITALQGTKTQLESAVATANGSTAMTVPGDTGMPPPAGLPGELPPAGGEEMGAELDLDIEEPPKSDSVTGRSKR
jgi:hypothetical protein